MSLKDKDSKPIVHIATDEKFIDAAYDIYEKAFPGKNRFIILNKGKPGSVKYLSNSIPYNFFDVKKQAISKLSDQISKGSLVMFHGMDQHQKDLALALTQKESVIGWTAFGYEVYDNPYLFGKNLFGENTYKIFVKDNVKSIKNTIRPFYYKLFKNSEDPFLKKIKAMRDAQFIGILFKEEYELYQKMEIIHPESTQLKFTYYPIDIVINKNTGYVKSDNILIGNSASFTNNHLEAFEKLESFDLGSRKLITPLSYGNKEYANQIIEIGRKKFGGNINALTDFLPISDYQEILQSCGIVIMNHYRQQAVGNVLNAIYLGAKIFLSNKNTLYYYLKRIGCYVYCIEEVLEPKNKTALKLLSIDQMKKNREILNEELSIDKVVNELRQKFKPILN